MHVTWNLNSINSSTILHQLNLHQNIQLHSKKKMVPIINFMSVIFMILFSALSIGGNAQITDTDGDPLINGGKYVILPKGISVNGGLTITSPCPYYITRSKDETFPGIPVTISSPFKIPFILPGLPISISFDYIIIDTCMKSFKWQVITDEKTSKSYVRTSGTGWSTDFSVFEDQIKAGSYRIKYNINDFSVSDGPNVAAGPVWSMGW